jgi:hypothetical protein
MSPSRLLGVQSISMSIFGSSRCHLQKIWFTDTACGASAAGGRHLLQPSVDSVFPPEESGLASGPVSTAPESMAPEAAGPSLAMMPSTAVPEAALDGAPAPSVPGTSAEDSAPPPAGGAGATKESTPGVVTASQTGRAAAISALVGIAIGISTMLTVIA